MKTIDINGRKIEIIIQRKKVKNINLRVREGKVFISASKKVPKNYILDFVNRNTSFIEKAILSARKKLRYTIANLEEKSQGVIFLFGKSYNYEYICNNEKSIKVEDNVIIIEAKSVDIAQKVLENYLKEKLSEYINEVNPEICNVFKNYGVLPAEINCRKMKSRWGSCYYNKNKIFLSTALATAPKECIKYVLFHEYTHFLYPNHQKEFYDFLSKYIPNYKLIKSYLNTYEKC